MKESITLKGGHITHNRKLDRVPFLDPRSRNFPIKEILPPEGARDKIWPCRRWLNQKQDGACVGFGWAHEVVAEPSGILRGINQKFARQTVYWGAQRVDEWPGGSYPGAHPLYEGTSVLAGAKEMKHLGYLGEYRWAFDMDDIILTLSNVGPIVFGMDWYEGMMEPNLRGVIHAEGEIMGGHCILANKILPGDQMVGLHNSWGRNWGLGGDCWIRFGDLEKILENQGESCVPTERLNPNETPPTE